MGVRNAGLTAVYLSPGVFKLAHVQHELKVSADFRKKIVVVQSLIPLGGGGGATCSFELEKLSAPQSLQRILADCSVIRSADAWAELLKTAGYPVPDAPAKPAIVSFNQVGPELSGGVSPANPKVRPQQQQQQHGQQQHGQQQQRVQVKVVRVSRQQKAGL
jgi:hypothetical protein